MFKNKNCFMPAIPLKAFVLGNLVLTVDVCVFLVIQFYNHLLIISRQLTYTNMMKPFQLIFSSPGAKGQVSFSQHLASGVHRRRR